MRSLAILGPQGSGKSTIASLFVEHRGYQRHGIADSIKHIAAMAYYDLGKNETLTVPRYFGEITLTGLSMTGLKPSLIGFARTLLITVRISATQRLVLWHGVAQYSGQVTRATVNGAVQLAHRFTLLSVSSRAGNIETI